MLPENLGQWETVEQIGIDSYHFPDALGDLKFYGLRVQLCYHRVGANFVDLHKLSPEMFIKNRMQHACFSMRFIRCGLDTLMWHRSS